MSAFLSPRRDVTKKEAFPLLSFLIYTILTGSMR